MSNVYESRSVSVMVVTSMYIGMDTNTRSFPDRE